MYITPISQVPVVSWNSVHYFTLWSGHKSVNTTLDSTNLKSLARLFGVNNWLYPEWF